MSRLNLADLRAVNETRGARWHRGGLQEWSTLEWAGAMCGEAGELANVAKKLRRVDTGARGRDSEQDRDALREKLAAECADVLIYLDLIAAREGIDLAAAVIAKFNATSEAYDFPERLRTEAPGVPMSRAEVDVCNERAKQRAKWGDHHDDEHEYGDLAVNAAILAVAGTDARVEDPLDRDGWGLLEKHPDDRDRAIIAAALLIAEVERLDRAAE